jgi:hypothetical protein
MACERRSISPPRKAASFPPVTKGCSRIMIHVGASLNDSVGFKKRTEHVFGDRKGNIANENTLHTLGPPVV